MPDLPSIPSAPSTQLDRRRLMTRLAVGGGLAWAAPVIVTSAAAAQKFQRPGKPPGTTDIVSFAVTVTVGFTETDPDGIGEVISDNLRNFIVYWGDNFVNPPPPVPAATTRRHSAASSRRTTSSRSPRRPSASTSRAH
jgi:hypothetical protein